MNPKRKEIEKIVIDTMNILDKSGMNGKFYQDFFKTMTDEQFNSYMKKFLADDSQNFYLELRPFEKGGEPKLEDIKEAADYLGVPLTEYLWMPYANPNGKPLRTIEPVPVGYLHMKRLQQCLSKKNTMSTDISIRNSKTNQVIGHDKSGRISDMENYALIAIGGENALKEYMGPRSDNSHTKQQMFKDIANQGYTRLSDYEDRPEDKVALNLLDVYFTGCGIMTDLLSPGLTTVYTNQQKQHKDLIRDKYNKKQ